MKSLVVYDSLYGNTEKIAEAIATGLSAADGDPPPGAPGQFAVGEDSPAHASSPGTVQRARVGDVQPEDLAGLDLLVVGAPTHGARPSPPAREFLDRIPDGGVAGVRIAAFDTRVEMDEMKGAARVFGRLMDRLGYAAPRILAALRKKGGQPVAPPEGFIVMGTEGPLEDGELERAVEWGRRIASTSPGAS